MFYTCDDCGEMFDRTEMVFDESGEIQMCDTDWADFQGQLAMEAYVDRDHRPKPAVDAYDLSDPKHPEYVEHLLDAADEREPLSVVAELRAMTDAEVQERLVQIRSAR